MRHFISTLDKKKPLVGAEIGVLVGAHAKEILDNLNMEKLYLVDPYFGSITNYHSALDLLKEYEDETKWFILPSVEACRYVDNGTLDFVYIDGLHSYEACFNDITAWHTKVKEGGFIAGHDWPSDSVENAVRDFLKGTSTKVFEYDLPDGDWYFVK